MMLSGACRQAQQLTNLLAAQLTANLCSVTISQAMLLLQVQEVSPDPYLLQKLLDAAASRCAYTEQFSCNLPQLGEVARGSEAC